MGAEYSAEQLRTAAGDLLEAFHACARTIEGSQAREVARARFEGLCEVGARAGLAQSAGVLEVVVVDVAEQLAPPGEQAPIEHGTDWVWLMQARWILARRLRQLLPPAAAA